MAPWRSIGGEIVLWLKTLERLRDALKAADIADEVIIGGYAPTDVRPNPEGKGLIYLQRDRERPEDTDMIPSISILCTIDAWVRSDSKDPADGYAAIARLESGIEEALQKFAREITWMDHDVQPLRLRITETAGDGDSMRPCVGSRFSVEIILCRLTD